MRASRRSHSTVSYGSTPGRVKRRSIPIPSCCGAIAMSRAPSGSVSRTHRHPPIEPLHLVVSSHLDREMEVHYSTVIPHVSTVSGRVRTLRPPPPEPPEIPARPACSALFRLGGLLQ